MIRVKPAPFWARTMLEAMSMRLLAWPPDLVYWIKSKPSQHELKHEAKHLEQYKRDGLSTYFRRWWWQYLTVGYENIDYEIEARKAELE